MKLTFLFFVSFCIATILQAQVSKTLDVAAGGLKTLLTPTELTTITNLTLTGTIDARDFKTMRDDMPLLEEIDLSSTTIVEYTGADGTYFWSGTFPANAIPEFSFCSPTNQAKTTLKTFIFPTTVTSIGRYAFEKCTGLNTITIPISVNTIGDYAFYSCDNLSSIIASGMKPINLSYTYGVFDNINKSNCTLIVPFGSKSAYESANQWKDFQKIEEKEGLFLSANILEFGANSGSAQLNIASSASWSAISDQSWLTIDPPIGVPGTGVITCSFEANQITSLRTAIITVNATGFDAQTIAVTQYVKVEVTAGNLKTMLADQLTSITNLTLIGTIDARDFKTMRDDMPLLAQIDLSGIQITDFVDRTGFEGTKNSLGFYYPENIIPDNAFCKPFLYEGKISLTSIILPVTATTVGSNSFQGCSSLTSITFSPSITTIGSGAFSECINLASINFSSSLNYIGDYAFDYCRSLVSVTIPSLVNFIGNNSFGHFNGLFTVEENNSYYSDFEGVLFNKTQTKLIQCPISKTGIYAIPNSVTTIGRSAFYGCGNLISILIPQSVSSIEREAFFDCNNLMSIVIPQSVINIERAAFVNCSQLTSITVELSVPVDLNASPYAFLNINTTNCTLYVPYGAKAAYKAANQWKDFENIVEMQPPVLSLETDSLALVALYNATDGPNWINNTNWLTGPVNTWQGVTVEDGRVTVLLLNHNNLNGNLPSEIGNLSNLKYLSLAYNQISGSIPSEIGNLTNLQSLILEVNQISGSIPTEIGSLTNLYNLYLNFNQISGSIPAEIGNIINLQNLYLYNNQIQGSIPAEIGNLTNLQDLYLNSNQISGSIPARIWNLTNLQNLWLGGNQLTGSIPAEIGNLTNLQYLYLYSTQLSGSIPSEIGNLTNLKHLYLFRNKLSGSIPNEIGLLTKLQQLDFSNNQLSGRIPAEISNLKQLLFLKLRDNHFNFLPNLNSIPNLYSLDCNYNMLTFSDLEPNFGIPEFIYSPQDSIGQHKDTTILIGQSFSYQLQTGGESNKYQWYKDGALLSSQNSALLEIPSVQRSNAGNYYCKVTNTIVTSLTLTSRIITLRAQEPPTLLQDSLALVALYNATNGPNWFKKTNWLTGHTSTWYGIEVFNGRVISIKLPDNLLSGTIPSEIGNLTNLQRLELNNNQLSGSIPAEIGNLTNLQYLYLYRTQLSGNIPSEIGYLTNLIHLYLFRNQLTGSIPNEFANLTNLQALSLGLNQLSGSIPNEIGNLTNLEFLSIYNNRFDFLPDLSSLTYLKQLYCHNNKLTFSDIEPNIGIATFTYSPQDSIGESVVYNKTKGENFTHTLVTGGTQNQYQWYKNGMMLEGQTSAVLEITNLALDNSGLYFCAVTNPQTPALTLYSKVITLVVNEPELICLDLNFKTGWNIFSAPNQTQFAGMDTVFLSCMTNNSLIKIQDESGNSMEDWGIYGGWKNNIGNISPTEGYKVKVSIDDNFELCGTPVEYPFAIPLKSGWNIMGYPQTSPFDALEVLQQLIDRGKLIKAQDEAGNAIEDWGIYGGWKNNIYDFVPGKGYNIKLSADDTLWINESYPKSSAILPEVAAITHFKTEFEGNGTDHMNINMIGLPLNVLRVGDELAVFDGKSCVGAVTIMQHHINNQSVAIAASARDNGGIPGFNEGNPFVLKLWNSQQNQEFTLQPEIVKGTATFTKNETTVASLEKYVTTGLDGISNKKFTEINCYPNPFGKYIMIDNHEKVSRIKITNVLGQNVLDSENPGHFTNTEKLIDGIYFITLFGKDDVLKSVKMIKNSR